MRLAGWFWLLSGLPFAAALILAWMYAPPVAIALFGAAIILEQGHVLSPLVLTWTHAPLRRVALERWPEFVLVPAAIMVAVFVAPSIPMPQALCVANLPWVFGFYIVWNTWHFGMQQYGVIVLHSRPTTADHRVLWALLCVVGTAFPLIVLPVLFGSRDTMGLIFLAGMAFGFQHWLVDIGFSSRVSKKHLIFIVSLIALGCVGFIWKRPFIERIGVIPFAVWPNIHLARWGAGIVHFWISARIWREPEIKAVF